LFDVLAWSRLTAMIEHDGNAFMQMTDAAGQLIWSAPEEPERRQEGRGPA